ncbi:hypothetical protein CC80DRAFT_505524 [Byssothecium circinans]|uniref:Uncharacterized protein n=1 Tax=Byssothecium circinans TaxID=147558 RepID=A0A6A5TU04_9PLEO|nr:hypothetical protein CC80DRAFT_505524 [Byssothecium circinans]
MPKIRTRPDPGSCQSRRTKKLKRNRIKPCSNCTARGVSFITFPNTAQPAFCSKATNPTPTTSSQSSILPASVPSYPPSTSLSNNSNRVPRNTHAPIPHNLAALYLSIFAVAAFLYQHFIGSEVASNEQEAIQQSTFFTKGALDLLNHSRRSN